VLAALLNGPVLCGADIVEIIRIAPRTAVADRKSGKALRLCACHYPGAGKQDERKKNSEKAAKSHGVPLNFQKNLNPDSETYNTAPVQ
jgi:hypothetical protein